MVIFFGKKGAVELKDIGYTIWPFVLVLLESGEYVIVAVEYGNYQENCVPFLKRLRPDLAVSCEKGGGVITVMPSSWSKLPQIHLRFCLDQCYRQPDWAIVEQTLREEFPEVVFQHWPK